MTLVRWEPFGELDRRFGRLFGPAFREDAVYHPRLDVSEDDDRYVVKADLPGMSDKDLDLTVKDDVLYIRGELEKEEEREGERYHVVERRHGVFRRTVSLPGPVDNEKVEAKFTDGVLEVVLPKSEAAKPKKIEVT
jgi:HSP20 family protein